MDFIYKSKVHNHSKIKKQLLDKINLIPTNPLHSNNESIMHTDWNLPPNMHREYAPLFLEVIKPHMAKITQDLKCSGYDIELFGFKDTDIKVNTLGTHILEHILLMFIL